MKIPQKKSLIVSASLSLNGKNGQKGFIKNSDLWTLQKMLLYSYDFFRCNAIVVIIFVCLIFV